LVCEEVLEVGNDEIEGIIVRVFGLVIGCEEGPEEDNCAKGNIISLNLTCRDI
jgi:hypothetical protein